MLKKLSRRLRIPGIAELIAESDLEKKADFEDKKKLEKLDRAVEKAKIEMNSKIAYDEEHSLYELAIHRRHEGAARAGQGKLGARLHAGI